MSENTKKIVLPGYLVRRLEAFRVVKGDSTSYLLRDKVKGKPFSVVELVAKIIIERLPTNSRLKISRPNWSVPSQ